MGKQIYPPTYTLPGEDDGEAVSYVFVGDEAFPLRLDFLRPYPRNRTGHELTDDKNIYSD